MCLFFPILPACLDGLLDSFSAQVFQRLVSGIAAVEQQVKAAGYEFAYNDHLGFIHRCVCERLCVCVCVCV
jgi:hypothetical protein